MCGSILFNGKGDLEEWLPFVALQGSKSFPEPSWASKKINYGNWHASNPPLGSFPNVIRLLIWCTLTLPPASSRSEEHTSELQSLMRISYAVFCLQQKNKQ